MKQGFLVGVAAVGVLLGSMAGSAVAAGRLAVQIGGDIWTVMPDGSGAVNITGSATVGERRPMWSPDGSRILFERSAAGKQIEIWSMAPDGSDQRTMIIAPGQNVLGADWSRDARQVVFWIQDTGGASTGAIWTANSDGTGATQVVGDLVLHEGRLDWSPTEDAVVFMINSTDAEGGIWVMRMDGTAGRAQILPAPTQNGLQPRWSADGAFLAYQGCAPASVCSLPHNDIWIMRGTGADRLKIVDTDFPNFTPAWSADGERLAYGARTSNAGPTELHIVNRNGTNDVTVPNLPAGVVSPDWEPSPTATLPLPPIAPTLPPPPVAAATVSRLRLAPTTFRAARRGPSIGKTGTKVTYTLAAPGTVTFKVLRRIDGRLARTCRTKHPPKSGTRCTAETPLKGNVRHTGNIGANSFRFTGRLSGKPLPPGNYTLAAQGPAGPAHRARFRIIKPTR